MKKKKAANSLLIAQKVAFYVFLAFLVLMFFVETVTKVQMAPFLIFVIMAYFSIYQKNTKINLAIVVLSVLMVLINLSIPRPSIIDVVLWLSGLTFIKSPKTGK